MNETMAGLPVAVPEVPAEVREAARQAGGGWLDEVIGSHPLPVSPSSVRGSWRLDANGDPTGDYVANPGFATDRPSRCPYARKD